jgi:hypothetical protein
VLVWYFFFFKKKKLQKIITLPYHTQKFGTNIDAKHICIFVNTTKVDQSPIEDVLHLPFTHPILRCLEKVDPAWTHDKYCDKILYISQL